LRWRCGKLALALLFFLPLALNAQVQRIVSTTPSITEMLFTLGLGDRVVGVTTACRYPEEATRLPKIGTFIQPNFEVILGLRPDLVIIQENPTQLRERFESLGLTVLELEHKSVDDIYVSLRRIAEAAGVPDRAEPVIDDIRTSLVHIREQAAALPRRRVMFVIGRTPGALEGLMAVGPSSYLNELMKIAGGENIFAEAVAAYPKVSLEEILARDPEVIIDMGEMAETVGVTEADKRRVEALWKRYPAITAVSDNRVFAVASDIFVVPGPRMVQAAQEFFEMLHSEPAP
jgi:iron complex transport system substrate-binding protein